MSTPSTVGTMTGNKIIITIDGKKVGMIQSLRASDDYGMQEVSQIGDIHVKEWVPSIARHTLTAAVVQLSTESLEAMNIAPKNGDDVMLGLVFDIIATKAAAPNTVLFTYKSCSFAAGDIEITKHQIVARNATIMALDRSGDWAPTVS